MRKIYGCLLKVFTNNLTMEDRENCIDVIVFASLCEVYEWQDTPRGYLGDHPSPNLWKYYIE